MDRLPEGERLDLANYIADKLFTDEYGERAGRLLFELPDRRLSFGLDWGPTALKIADAIGEFIDEQKAKPARPAAPRPDRRTGRSG